MIKQFIEKKVQQFRLFWGIAPEDSLKYKKGQEVEEFIATGFTDLTSLLEEKIRGKIRKVPMQEGKWMPIDDVNQSRNSVLNELLIFLSDNQTKE